MKRIARLLLTVLAAGALNQTACSQDLPLQRIKLPSGFQIEVYAAVPGPRSLALGDNGTVFVGTQREGSVFALVPRVGAPPEVLTIAKGLNTPTAWRFAPARST